MTSPSRNTPSGVSRPTLTIVGHVLSDGASVTWQVLRSPDENSEAIYVNFPVGNEPPLAHEAKRYVANALKADKVSWIDSGPHDWILDLDTMCAVFSLSESWIRGRVSLQPQYELSQDPFKQGVVRGLLRLVVEREKLTTAAVSNEPSRGVYHEDDLAEVVSLARRKRFDSDLAWLCASSALAYSLLVIDVDHFKSVNDTFGHPVGDAVLVRVAEIVREVVGRRGLGYRYGGEEFAALLPAFNRREAAALGESIRARVASETWAHNVDARVTVSIGVADRVAGESPIDFIKRADSAMYNAKKGGRNRVCVAASEVSGGPDEGL